MKKLTALERLSRTLNFKDTDTVATGEIFQNSEIISRFAERKINDFFLTVVQELIKKILKTISSICP
jgi:hypothetical protein